MSGGIMSYIRADPCAHLKISAASLKPSVPLPSTSEADGGAE